MNKDIQKFVHILSEIFKYLDNHPEILDDIFKSDEKQQIESSDALNSTSEKSILDIYEVYSKAGMEGLEQALEKLEIDDLKEIVKKYRLDPKRYFYKWTTKRKFIEFIKDKIASKLEKGQSFVSSENEE